MTDKLKKDIQFKITDIRKINHFENDFEKYEIDENELKNINFKLNLGLHFDPEKNKISFRIKCTFAGQKNVQNDLFGIETITGFVLKNFNEIVTVDEFDEYQIHNEIIEFFLTLSLAHTRGMLAALNTNPKYQNIILPFVNAKDVLKNAEIPK